LATAPVQASLAASPSTASSERKSYLLPLSVLTSLFFIWGFLTCLNDILIPHLKAAFSLSYAEAALIQFCFFGAYFLVSMPAGAVVKRIGYQRGIVIGLLIAGIGCLAFYPAAATRSYALFLTALFTLAVGITVLQVSANPYVAILGRPETASSRLTLTQAFNSLGTFLAPYFGSALILSVAARGADDLAKLSAADAAAYRAAEASSVQVPYLWLAATLVVIAVIMGRMKLPVIAQSESPQSGMRVGGYRESAWAYPHLVLGALGIFVYVGGEVAIGSFLVNFMAQSDIAGLSDKAASLYLPMYWGGAMVGRFIGAYLLKVVRPGVLLAISAGIASALVLLCMTLNGYYAMWAILSVVYSTRSCSRRSSAWLSMV
jgi:MFS transporter, FHS family, L-fucose permease